MRKFACLLGIVAVLGLTVSTANAVTILQDNFNGYAPGDLVPQGGWANHSGTDPLYFVQVVEGSLCYCEGDDGNYIQLAHGSGSREDVNKLIGMPDPIEMGPGDKWYAGFCVVVNAPEPMQDDNYFAHFKTSGTYFANKVFDGPANVAGNDFTFGFQAAGGGEVASVFWPTDFEYGTCHRIITSYDYDTGYGEMWVDPICDLGPDGNLKIDDTGYTANALVAYAFRQDSYYPTPNPTEKIDSLCVATTWEEVCCECVPEPASLLLLGLAGVLIRRR